MKKEKKYSVKTILSRSKNFHLKVFLKVFHLCEYVMPVDTYLNFFG